MDKLDIVIKNFTDYIMMMCDPNVHKYDMRDCMNEIEKAKITVKKDILEIGNDRVVNGEEKCK